MNFLEMLKEKIFLGDSGGDSGVATLLYHKGVYMNRCFDEVNLSNPGLVEEVHFKTKFIFLSILFF